MAKRLTMDVIVEENKKKLQELIPDEKSIICRYMSFPKYMSLLVNNSLFFTRADKFEDPLEGEVPEQYLKRLFFWNIDSPFADMFYDTFKITIDNEKERAKILESYYQKRKTTFINCWNEFNTESYALWKIYAEKYGVAIQTTVKKLQEVTKSRGASIYKVKYLDDKTSHIIAPRESDQSLEFNNHNFFVFKKAEYTYENEIRAIITGLDGEYQEVKINDLSNFVDKIIVSPFAEEWFAKMVRDISSKYGLENVEVQKSSVEI